MQIKNVGPLAFNWFSLHVVNLGMFPLEIEYESDLNDYVIVISQQV